MSTVSFDDSTLDRMVLAVELVRNRLKRAVAALSAAGIPHAVVGDNAVAACVSQIDPAAVRNTQDVDIALRRADLEAAKIAMAGAGFVFRHVKGIDMFLDGADAKARDAVHILFAGEKVRAEDAAPAVELVEFASLGTTATGPIPVASLESLVRMKLTSYRLKDQVHLQDMLGVGLIDESWPAKFSSPLAERLRWILENPEA